MRDAAARQNVRLLDPVLALDAAIEAQCRTDRFHIVAGPRGNFVIARDARGMELRLQRSIDRPDAREIIAGWRTGGGNGGDGRYRWRDDRRRGRRRCPLASGSGRWRLGWRRRSIKRGVTIGTAKGAEHRTHRRCRSWRHECLDERNVDLRTDRGECQPGFTHRLVVGPRRWSPHRLAGETPDDATREISEQENEHRLPSQRNHLQSFPRPARD